MFCFFAPVLLSAFRFIILYDYLFIKSSNIVYRYEQYQKLSAAGINYKVV